MSSYNLGQVIGVLVMVLIAAATTRDVIRKRRDRTEV